MGSAGVHGKAAAMTCLLRIEVFDFYIPHIVAAVRDGWQARGDAL